MYNRKVKKSVKFLSMENIRDLIKKTTSLKSSNTIKRTSKKTLSKTLHSLLFGKVGNANFKNDRARKLQNGLVLIKNAEEDLQKFTVKTPKCKSHYRVFSLFVTHFKYHRAYKL